MKRNKILSLFLIFILAFSLASCSSRIGIDYVENENTTYTKIDNDVTKVYDTVKSGCVGIYTSSASSASTGSGVIYKKADSLYYVVTNAHVVENKTSYKINLGGVKYYNANLVGYDSTNDIAVLTFNLDILSANEELYINSIDETTDVLTPGQTVIAIGCPLGLENYNYLTTGVISKITSNEIQHDASSNPGNSGGGLFNLAGRLIGINYAKEVYTTGEVNGSTSEIPVDGMSYSIPMNIVRSCIKIIERKGGEIKRPELGISVVAVNKYIETSTSLIKCVPKGSDYGLVIRQVNENSNAEKAGLTIGDCLLKVDNIDITDTYVLTNLLHSKEIGDKISIYYYHYGSDKYNTIEFILL